MIVVDTHVAVWDALKPGKLSAKAKQAIADANKGGGIVLSDISLWEIGMLMQSGRLAVKSKYASFIELLLKSNKYRLHRITPEIVNISLGLKLAGGNDYVDRIIVATAITNKMTLVTADPKLHQHDDILTVW